MNSKIPPFKHILFTVLLSFFCFSSKGQLLPSELKDWQGTWYLLQKQDTLFEKWVVENDSSMIGESWIIKANKDSVHNEYLRLFVFEQNIIYEPLVKSQHGLRPIAFGMILQTSNYWMFHNSENDFPKFITYKRISDKKLKATISNSDNPDKKNSVEFDYTLYQR